MVVPKMGPEIAEVVMRVMAGLVSSWPGVRLRLVPTRRSCSLENVPRGEEWEPNWDWDWEKEFEVEWGDGEGGERFRELRSAAEVEVVFIEMVDILLSLCACALKDSYRSYASSMVVGERKDVFTESVSPSLSAGADGLEPPDGGRGGSSLSFSFKLGCETERDKGRLSSAALDGERRVCLSSCLSPSPFSLSDNGGVRC
jgi:hypothetical protein